MEVIKRNGTREAVSFDKITKRITNMVAGRMGENISISCLADAAGHRTLDPIVIVKEVVKGIFDGITTAQLDVLAADVCASKIHTHPDYNKLAARLLVSNLHKQTHPLFSETTEALHREGIVSPKYRDYIINTPGVREALDDALKPHRDYLFDYFGFRTLERSYLFNRKEGKRVTMLERPQHMWMRVAVQIHGLKDDPSVDDIIETYEYLSQMYFTHATPTLFNAGTNRQQMSSCFLTNIEDDITSIFKTVSNIAHISKYAGGIGLSITPIRAKGSLIRTTNGLSEGIVPMCKVIEATARYINQGGKRLGSVAVYLEPWHADVFDFVELRKPTGDENLRCRDLFLALWVPDEFMRRVEADDDWYLMCPDKQPGLVDAYGEAFTTLYNRYVAQGKYMRKVRARDLWNRILEAQIETGMPYMSYKDHVNTKSNQANLGTIRNSNLCVSGETRVLTDRGYLVMRQIVGQTINAWNGWEWSSVTVQQTGTSVQTLNVHLSTGQVLEVTPEHKFYTSPAPFDDETEVAAKDLKPGDRLASCLLPVVRGEDSDLFFGAEQRAVSDPCNVPTNAGLAYRVKWLQGLLTHPVNVDLNGSEGGVRIAAQRPDGRDLLEVRLLLTTLGCSPVIRDSVLYLSDTDVASLCSLGFRPCVAPRVDLDAAKLVEEQVSVLRVEQGTVQDTFCFTEPLRHRAVFDGIYTGQCNEIVEYSSKSETAVCNLASLCLPKFVEKDGTFNYARLMEVTRLAVRNLNTIIDLNYYPIHEAKASNIDHRPIGLGIQGLADVYIKMRLPFESPEAEELNRSIMEHIQYAALDESSRLAEKSDVYSSYHSSPAWKGQLQHDLWGVEGRLDWTPVRERIARHGLRNSLVTALMPTASTAQICGNTESFEPITSNIYVRKTLAGEFIVVNEHLVRDLIRLNLWSKEMYDTIIYFNGSIQKITDIPTHIRELYKTAFEIKQSAIIRQAAGRGPFVDQTQSMNLFMERPDFSKLTSAHFYGWRLGLKTGMYYLRTQPAVDPIKFGLDHATIASIRAKYDPASPQQASPSPSPTVPEDAALVCVRRRRGEPTEGCDACSA